MFYQILLHKTYLTIVYTLALIFSTPRKGSPHGSGSKPGTAQRERSLEQKPAAKAAGNLEINLYTALRRSFNLEIKNLFSLAVFRFINLPLLREASSSVLQTKHRQIVELFGSAHETIHRSADGPEGLFGVQCGSGVERGYHPVRSK